MDNSDNERSLYAPINGTNCIRVHKTVELIDDPIGFSARERIAPTVNKNLGADFHLMSTHDDDDHHDDEQDDGRAACLHRHVQYSHDDRRREMPILDEARRVVCLPLCPRRRQRNKRPAAKVSVCLSVCHCLCLSPCLVMTNLMIKTTISGIKGYGCDSRNQPWARHVILITGL